MAKISMGLVGRGSARNPQIQKKPDFGKIRILEK
jgi:hypothetical protein